MLFGVVTLQKRSGDLPLFILYSVVGKMEVLMISFVLQSLCYPKLNYLIYHMCAGVFGLHEMTSYSIINVYRPAVLIIEKAQLLMEEFVKVNLNSSPSFTRSNLSSSTQSASVHWLKPVFPFVKINVDGGSECSCR